MKRRSPTENLYASEVERACFVSSSKGTTMMKTVAQPLPALRYPLLLMCLTLLGASLLLRAAQKKGVVGSVISADRGRFNILVDGKLLGREEFEIMPGGSGWVAKGTTHLTVEGSPAMTVTGTLALQPDGAPISYDWTSQSDKTNGAHVAFENGIAKMTLQMAGATRPFEQDLSFDSRMVVVLDNNLYHQYGVLSQIYDWSHRGEQAFSVLIPQQLTPGTIHVTSTGNVSAEGKNYEGLTVKTNDIELQLYLDGNHHLMRLEVPASKAAVVRE
jgi:hypothetical protein